VSNRIGIVVPTIVNFKGLAELIVSIETRLNYQIYIIDNWNKHYCVSKSWNIGAEKAIENGCSHIAILNDDIILGPYALDAMYWFLLSRPEPSLVSGCRVGSFDETNSGYVGEGGENFEATESGPQFSCFMITPELYRTVGSFDENFVPAYFEDNDYHYRTKLLDVNVYHLGDAPYITEESVTHKMTHGTLATPNKFNGNRAYYVKKWGGVPGIEKFDHPYNDPNLTPSQWEILDR